MDSFIIVDSGSTKSDWLFLRGDCCLAQIRLAGMNPHFTSPTEMQSEIERGVPEHLRLRAWTHLCFYGSGCTPGTIQSMTDTLRSSFNIRHLSVESDLVGAARALWGTGPGIACILGTGSATGFYDGTTITHRSPSLGYILGDEGSGAHLGKLLVNAVLKHQVPPQIEQCFDQYVRAIISVKEGLEPAIIDRVYHAPFPNRFLARLSPFLKEHISEEWARDLTLQAFRLFLAHNVRPLGAAPSVGFVGSIAHCYQDILLQAASLEGMTISQIIQSPLAGLKQYHVH